MNVITRFAPSPTGDLHIGSARTAIYNYLFAKHYKGKFLIRVEDTDKTRSTKESLNSILYGIDWLGLSYDDKIIYQSQRHERHKEVALDLLRKGKAYKCFLSSEEIEHQKADAKKNKKSFLLQSPWRNKQESELPNSGKYVIRIKAPQIGNSVIDDLVQGRVDVSNKTLDDFVLLRSDGTPTYMLAVVVDDYDMNITHVVRGDDHLNNAFRQKVIYDALDWKMPKMAHIPLIHGPDGAKLSKRHGSVGIEEYRQQGYLPEAIFSYLLRLGWSLQDKEVISRDEAILHFDGSHIGKSAARIDFEKLKFINAEYLRSKTNQQLLNIILDEFKNHNILLQNNKKFNDILLEAMEEIKVRSELTGDLVELAKIYHPDNIFEFSLDAKQLISTASEEFIDEIIDLLTKMDISSKENVSEEFKLFSKYKGVKLGQIMAPIRAIITGKTASPSVFSIISLLGRDVVIERLYNAKKLRQELSNTKFNSQTMR